MAKIVAISISEKKGIPKDNVSQITCVEEHGLEGDAHGGPWHRQVSLLGQESIDKMIASGVDGLKPGKFAENITTEGIVLWELPVGTKMEIGETLHEVTQIGKECHSKCAIYHQVGNCVMPTEGIFTRVLQGGVIRPGDAIQIIMRPSEVV